MCYFCSAPNQIDVLLKIRDMWTFNKHKESVSDHYSFVASAAPGAVLSTINVTICGDKLLVRLEFGGANQRMEQLLVNWKTLHAAVSHPSPGPLTRSLTVSLATCEAGYPVSRPRSYPRH